MILIFDSLLILTVRVDEFVDVLWRDLLVEKFLEEFLVWTVWSEIEQVFLELALGHLLSNGV